MAATEVQQLFEAAVDCVLNKLEGKFTLKIEQKLALHDFLHKKDVFTLLSTCSEYIIVYR